jgi:predicted lipoprotein with Yx(FWY)xxD motif
MNHKRIRLSLLSVAAGMLIASVSAVALAHGAPASAAGAPTVKLRSTGIGKILVNGSGDTVFMFTRDKRNKDTCVKVSGCSATWPALKIRGRPHAGPGVKSSRLGTITLAHGVKQVTYAGHPLYTFSLSSPGDTSYVGTPEFGGKWYAVNAAGRSVR